MTRRTKNDMLALVNGHHTNDAEVGAEVYIARDEREEWGEKYDEGPDSAKPYNYRANRLEQHGWVEDVSTSDVAPQTRAVGTLTESGARILEAAFNSEAWDLWNDKEISTAEFLNRVVDSDDEDTSENGQAASDVEVDEFESLPGSTIEDKIAYHDDDYPSNTHGVNHP